MLFTPIILCFKMCKGALNQAYCCRIARQIISSFLQPLLLVILFISVSFELSVLFCY